MMMFFACSGPGAAAAIAHNTRLGYRFAAVEIGLLGVSIALFALGLRSRVGPFILIGLLLLHPAWTVSPYYGDCGDIKVMLSWVFLVLGILVLPVQAVLWYAGYRINKRAAWIRQRAACLPAEHDTH
jgi:hypothetical protein